MPFEISFLTIGTDDVALSTCEFLLVVIGVLVAEVHTSVLIIDDVDPELLTLN